MNEPRRDKTNEMACAPSEDSDQPGHPPILIRVFALRTKKVWVLSCLLSAHRRLIILGECPGWSESSLGAHAILLVLSRCGSNSPLIIAVHNVCVNGNILAVLNFWRCVYIHVQMLFLLIFRLLKYSYGPRQANLILIACASSEGSGEPAHPRSLARTSATRSYKQWVKRNRQAESQIPGPSEWLGMRS